MIAQLRINTGLTGAAIAPNAPLIMEGRQVGKILEYNPSTGHVIAAIYASELELIKKLETGGRIDSVSMETKK